MTHDEMIAVIQAHRDGKQIECQAIEGSGAWMTASCPNWDFYRANFRVKPEPPKPREWWINAYDNAASYAYDSREEALGVTCGLARRKAVHVREVLHEQEGQ